MDYTLINLNTVIIVGLPRRTRNQNGKAMHDIPLIWDRFYKEDVPNRIPYRKNNEILGAYVDYEKDFEHPYTFIAGCEVSKVEKVPEGLMMKQLPPALYAVFKTEGSFPESLIQTWEMIWSLPLKRTYTGDFERYGASFFGNPHNPSLEIYIAVESASSTA